MNKEEVFEIIDESKKERATIRFSKKYRAKGFYIIMQEGTFSNRKGIFTTSKLALRKLDKAKIKYKIIK